MVGFSFTQPYLFDGLRYVLLSLIDILVQFRHDMTGLIQCLPLRYGAHCNIGLLESPHIVLAPTNRIVCLLNVPS